MSETSTVSVAQPNGERVVTDARGRRLTVNRIDAMQQFDIFEAMGASGGSEQALGMAILACSVSAVDGVPVPFPRSKDAIRQHIGRVGFDGINAAGSALAGGPEPDVKAGLEIAKN